MPWPMTLLYFLSRGRWLTCELMRSNTAPFSAPLPFQMTCEAERFSWASFKLVLAWYPLLVQLSDLLEEIVVHMVDKAWKLCLTAHMSGG